MSNRYLLFSSLVGLLLLGPFAFGAVARPGDYVIDPSHSNIGFEVGHMCVSLVVGRFNKFQGTIHFAPNGASKVHVEIDASSVDTNQSQRDDHLRSEDFFSVEDFPKAIFDSESMEYNEDGSPKLIKGRLTLHGQTREIVLEVTPLGAAEGRQKEFRAGFKAKTVIKRSEFGMGNLLVTVGDEVTLNLNVEAIQK